ncbi:MAG: glycosyltransferase [Calditrichia bacterium]
MTYPEIDVVIIGINVELYLTDCIASVRRANYPQELLSIVYVDGGSKDASLDLAINAEISQVIALRHPHPTPGRGRNAGYKAGHAPYIQFLDADTELDPEWFNKALGRMQGQFGAIIGRRREKHPNKNRYHQITNLEWELMAGKRGYNYEEGPCRSFGGDALVRREALESVNGYDEHLVAGEDPDVGYRMRSDGWQIYRLIEPMTTHDINMTSAKQYWRRAYRSGHAYAEIAWRNLGLPERLFQRPVMRILFGATAPIAILAAGFLGGIPILSLLIAVVAFLRPLWKTTSFKKTYGLSTGFALLYAVHLALVVVPQFFGMLRFAWGKIGGARLQNTIDGTVLDSVISPPRHMTAGSTTSGK